MIISDVLIKADKDWRDRRACQVPLKNWHEATCLLLCEVQEMLPILQNTSSDKLTPVMREKFEKVLTMCLRVLEQVP